MVKENNSEEQFAGPLMMRKGCMMLKKSTGYELRIITHKLTYGNLDKFLYQY